MRGSGLVLLLAASIALSTAQVAWASGEVVVSRVVLFEISPPFSVIDAGQRGCFMEAYERAREAGAVFVYVVNSPGGFLYDAVSIASVILYGDVPSVAVINGEAFSAAVVISLPADHLVAVEGSAAGSVVPGYLNPFTLKKTPSDVSSAWVAGFLKTAAALRARNASVAESFVYDALVVDSSTALSLGVVDAVVGSVEELPGYLNGLVIEKNGARYRLVVGEVERYVCSVHWRTVSALSALSTSPLAPVALAAPASAASWSIVKKRAKGAISSLALTVLLAAGGTSWSSTLLVLTVLALAPAVSELSRLDISMKERALRAVHDSSVPLMFVLLLSPLDIPADVPADPRAAVYWLVVISLAIIALRDVTVYIRRSVGPLCSRVLGL